MLFSLLQAIDSRRRAGVKLEAAAKAAAEKQASDAAAKVAADKIAAEKASAAKLIAELQAQVAKLAAAQKQTTITCVKGKITKKVTGLKPVCPSGYKKK